MEQNKYQIFDDKEAEHYQLVVASNGNIRKVCRVLTECHTLTQQQRVYYAKHGDIQPEIQEDEKTGDKSAVYTFKEKYDDVTVWAALAEVLFMDGPSLLNYDEDNNAYVPEEKQEQFDNLIRSQVMAGRDDFLQKFGVTAPEVNDLLKSLANVRIPLTMQNLMQAANEAPAKTNTGKT